MKRSKHSDFGKKANVQDLVVIVIIIFVLTVTALIVGKVVFSFNAQVQKMNNDNIPQEAKDISQSLTNKTPTILDTFIFLITCVVFLVSLISCWFIDVHPVFFVVSIIILIIVLVIAGVIQNANEAMLSADGLSDIAIHFPLTIFIGQNLFKIVTAMGFLLISALYAKSRSGAMT